MGEAASARQTHILDLIEVFPWHVGGRRWATRPLENIRKIVVHQALADCSVDELNRYHITPGLQNHVSRLGCPHLCYHFAISGGFKYEDGLIIKANRLTDITWHVKGHNGDSIGIVLEGDLRGPGHENAHDPTTRQLESLLWLINFLHESGDYAVRGHCDFGKPACPGYAAADVVRSFQR